MMYGNFTSKPDKKDSQDKKLDHINKMRKIYLPSRKIGEEKFHILTSPIRFPPC